jgi:hypothetical protein
MQKQGFTQYNQLEAYYSQKLLNIVKGLNKKATVWQGKNIRESNLIYKKLENI